METRNSKNKESGRFSRLRQWARTLKRDIVALYLAARNPQVPWYAKVVAGGVAAYALSPLDLIPDFIPVIGYLDDLIIVPLGIALAIRLIPSPIMEECRREAGERLANRPTSRIGAAVIITIWLILALLVIFWLADLLT